MASEKKNELVSLNLVSASFCTSSLPAQNGGLHSSSVSDGLIGVDGLAGLLAVEKVGHQLLHLGNASRAADQNNLVDAAFVHARIPKHLTKRQNQAPTQNDL